MAIFLRKTGVIFLCLFALLVFVSCASHQQDNPEGSDKPVEISDDNVKSRPDQSIKDCR